MHQSRCENKVILERLVVFTSILKGVMPSQTLFTDLDFKFTSFAHKIGKAKQLAIGKVAMRK